MALKYTLYNISNKVVYQEICERLQKPYGYSKQYHNDKSQYDKEQSVEIASLEVRDKTYQVYLSLLTLKEEDSKQLEQRGLTKEQIKFCGFKSIPKEGMGQMITEMLQRNCILKGVPGFYLNTSEIGL